MKQIDKYIKENGFGKYFAKQIMGIYAGN